MYVYIHAIEAGYQRRDGQGDGQARHAFHNGVDVVGDDGSEGIHRAREYVAVDVYCVIGLLQLDYHVFEQCHVKILRALEDVSQPPYHDLVAAYGGVEIDECFL